MVLAREGYKKTDMAYLMPLPEGKEVLGVGTSFFLTCDVVFSLLDTKPVIIHSKPLIETFQPDVEMQKAACRFTQTRFAS